MATLSKPKRQYRRIQRPKIKTCTWCGTEYQAIRSDSLYCSASCATLASLQRLRNAKPEEYEARLKKNAQKAKEKRYEQIENEKRMKLAEEEKLKQQIEAQKREEKNLIEAEKRKKERFELGQKQATFNVRKTFITSSEYEKSWKRTELELQPKIQADELHALYEKHVTNILDKLRNDLGL